MRVRGSSKWPVGSTGEGSTRGILRIRRGSKSWRSQGIKTPHEVVRRSCPKVGPSSLWGRRIGCLGPNIGDDGLSIRVTQTVLTQGYSRGV